MKRYVKSSLEEFNDIDRQYSENEARIQQQNAIRDSQRKDYMRKKHEVNEVVKQFIENIVSSHSSDKFMKDVDIYSNIERYSSDSGLYGDIEVEYGRANMHSDEVPLSWSWSLELGNVGKKGAINRSTSSWSGMTAVNADQIDLLKQSVDVLEALAKVSDEDIINAIPSDLPVYDEVITQHVERSESEYDVTLKKLDALAGTGYLVEAESDGWYFRIEKATAKQYQVSEYQVTHAVTYRQEHYPARIVPPYTVERMSKQKLYGLVKVPVKITTMEDLQDQVDRENAENGSEQ